MKHVLPLVYAQWFMRPEDEGAKRIFVEKGSANVQNDLDEVESQLQRSAGPFLTGQTFTIA